MRSRATRTGRPDLPSEDPTAAASRVLGAVLDGLRGGNGRKAAKLSAACDLLDAAGWGVAHRDSRDGSLHIGEHGRRFLETRPAAAEKRPGEWRDLLAIIPPELVELASPGLIVWRTAATSDPSPGRTARLTAREREVLGWITAGKTAPEVAVIVGCARRTVETHVANGYRKLGVNDRASLILNELVTGHGVSQFE